MKVVSLVSGGKDSCFNMMKCVRYGHQIVALANLKPPESSNKDELDSFMYQSVGHEIIDAYAECLGVPLFRGDILGKPIHQTLHYDHLEAPHESNLSSKEEDEVESLYNLLKKVKEAMPEVEAVSSGAILSNYQRNRVENVCTRLGLISLAFLWQCDQKELLEEMIENNIEAILIKVAAIGLYPKKHLGRTISDLYAELCQLNQMYELNVCGEGGEYESLTLDCPLFRKRIVVDESVIMNHGEADTIAPVAYLKVLKFHLENKDESSVTPVNATIQVNTLAPTPLSEKFIRKSTKKENSHIFEKPIMKSNGPFLYVGNVSPLSTRKFEELEGLTVQDQVRTSMDHMRDLVLKAGLQISDVAFVFIYLSDMSQFVSMNGIYYTYFGVNPPSRACVELPLPSPLQVMVECIAYNNKYVYDDEQMTDVKTLHVQSISDWAPACIGPYSQAKSINNIIHLAGQIGLNPPTMTLASPDPLAQSQVVIKNLSSVLDVLRSSLNDVIQCNIYVTDSSYRSLVEAEWKKSVTASSVNNTILNYVGVSRLPKDSKVEIQLIALERNIFDDVQHTTKEYQGQTGDLSYNINSTSTFQNDKFCLMSLSVVVDSKSEVRIENHIDILNQLMINAKVNVADNGFQWEKVLMKRLYYNVRMIEETHLMEDIKRLDDGQNSITPIPCTSINDNAYLLMEMSLYE